MKYAVPAFLALVVAATAVWASVLITYPVEGQSVGPATDVRGQASQRAFLVVYTQVSRASDHMDLGVVPGTRQWTARDGSYAVRIATPRGIHDNAVPLEYEIHVNAYSSPDKAPRYDSPPDLGSATVKVVSG